MIDYPNISCHEHTQNFPKWNPNAPHRTNLAYITGQYSCSGNSRNYISDVTFNYFYSNFRKVPRIKADVLTPVPSTPYDSWFDFSTFDFFVALSARRFIVGASLELRTTDEADTAHLVNGLPTARKPWYIFSPDLVQIATFLACNASARHRLFWINAECICRRRFHYSISFALFLSEDASKAKIIWHLSM